MIIVLSGEIAAGKTTLAKTLQETLDAEMFKTRDELAKRLSGTANRHELQILGEKIDADTDFGWVAYTLRDRQIVPGDVIIDSVRRAQHVDKIRDQFPLTRVLHVHLWARGAELRERFAQRGDADSYEEAKANPTEAQVNDAAATADLVIDTSHCSAEDVARRVLCAVQPHKGWERNVDVIVGGQYGSEGKGHVVSHIANEYEILVRVGGPNAGHTVLNPRDGHKVSFYHLPSGALHNRRAHLLLGAGAVINPAVLRKEAEYLGGLEALRGRLWIDPQANIITGRDIEMETGLVAGIGSTGQGVGVATAGKITERSAPTMVDGLAVAPCRLLARDIEELKPFIAPTIELIDTNERILLEGTQGTGLSLHHGHYPYVTSRDTTASGTAGEAGIPPTRIRKSIIVMRTNPIRVQSPAGGTSGPMGKEITWEEVSERAGVPAEELRKKEMTTTTKRQRRVAEFNWGDLFRACRLNGPTDIALTFVDYINHANQNARRFEQLTPETHAFVNEIERVSAVPVSLITTRFHRRSIIDRRMW